MRELINAVIAGLILTLSSDSAMASAMVSVVSTNEQEMPAAETANMEHENILGYTLMRTTGNTWYEEDPDYIVDKDMLGKGIFISEHMSENEVKLGSLLRESVESRGDVPEANRTYFSDWALSQIEAADFTVLDDTWTSLPYTYDRSYEVSYLFGAMGYDFSYIFYPDLTQITGEETQYVSVKALVDHDGIIKGAEIQVHPVSVENAEIADGINTTGLCDDVFREKMIEEGLVYEDRILLDFSPYGERFLAPGEKYEQKLSGFLISGDGATSAKETGSFLIDVLEHGGTNVSKYEEEFAYESFYEAFRDVSWDQLEDNWKANPYYDCYYVDTVEATGYVQFLYYIYPDYDAMHREVAKALTVKCNVGEDGKLAYTEVRMYAMTRQEYQTARVWIGQRGAAILNGEVAENDTGIIYSLADSFTSTPLRDYKIPQKREAEDDSSYLSYSGVDDGVRGRDLGITLLKDLKNGDFSGVKELSGGEEAKGLSTLEYEIEEIADQGWSATDSWDFYLLPHNGQAERFHYQYYFYLEKQGEANKKVLVLDAWVSESRLEEVKASRFTTGFSWEQERTDRQVEDIPMQEDKSDLLPYLAFDWIDEEVLWHDITPGDSAYTWSFYLGDIDLDGSREMLISFPAIHCGGNALYIYGQQNGQVVSVGDTYATPGELLHISEWFYRNRISSYLDIDFLDVYLKEGEYRYLSLDYSSVGGIDTMTLYETALTAGKESEKLVEIVYPYYDTTYSKYVYMYQKDYEKYYGTEREMYFRGQPVYELGALRDLLAAYMEDYVKVEPHIQDTGFSFPREIMALDEEEQKIELEKLNESLR